MKKRTFLTILSVLLVLLLILTLVFLLYLRDSENGNDNVVQEQTVDMNENAEEGIESQNAEPAQEPLDTESFDIDGEIINEELITSEFLSDFPLLGGEIHMFRDFGQRVILRMNTQFTAEEVYDWFTKNLENTEWDIEDSELNNDRGSLTINSEEAEGVIEITERELNTNITINFSITN